MENEIKKEEFLRSICSNCTVSRIHCACKCEVVQYADERYEKCVDKYNENDGNMVKTFDYILGHLQRKYA